MFFVLSLQTARLCWNVSGSRGGREQSTFLKWLALITTILVSTSWMTQMELESITLNLNTDKTLSESTQRSSESGWPGEGRNQWPGKHWRRCYVILNLVLLLVRLKSWNWSKPCRLYYKFWYINYWNYWSKISSHAHNIFTIYHKSKHFCAYIYSIALYSMVY